MDTLYRVCNSDQGEGNQGISMSTVEVPEMYENEESALKKQKLEEEEEEEEEEGCGGSSLTYEQFLEEEEFVGPEGPKRRADYYRYKKQLEETDGFGIDFCLGYPFLGAIHPLDITKDEVFSAVKDCVDFAINQYNNNQNANLKLEKILKVTSYYCAGRKYFITFEASDSSSSSREKKTYQTKVYRGREETCKEVELLRLKPEAHNYSY